MNSRLKAKLLLPLLLLTICSPAAHGRPPAARRPAMTSYGVSVNGPSRHPRITEIIRAVDDNDDYALREIFKSEKGPNGALCRLKYNSSSLDKEPLLCYAIIQGCSNEVIQLLADHSEIADFIENDDFTSGDLEDCSAIHIAAISGNVDAAKILLDSYNRLSGKDDYLRLLDGRGISPLSHAIMHHKYEMTEFLLDQGASTATEQGLYSGYSTWHYAVSADSHANRFADSITEPGLPPMTFINLLKVYTIEDANVPDDDGDTPLMVATKLLKDYDRKSAIEIVEQIEDSKSVEDDPTKLNAVRDLIKTGNADVDYQNDSRNSATALHIAAINGNLRATKTLVEEGGADISITDAKGRTALDMAIKRGHKLVERYLRAIQSEEEEATPTPPATKRCHEG